VATSTTLFGPHAYAARAWVRRAVRSRVAMDRRIGSPTYCPCAIGVPGKLVATYLVNRAPSRLAQPGRGLASCTTIGTPSRRAAM
jgi:hypothetical protein